MTTNDTEYSGQAQSAASEFGGEEGIEDAGQRCLIHAGACVVNFQKNELPRFNRIAGEVVGNHRGIDFLQVRGDDNAAACGTDRFGAIDYPVDHQLLNLAAIGIDENAIGFEIQNQFHLSRDRGLEQRRYLSDLDRKMDRL